MNRETQCFDFDEYTLVVVRSFQSDNGEWWHDIMTLRDESQDPWPGGHVEQYSERWVRLWLADAC